MVPVQKTESFLLKLLVSSEQNAAVASFDWGVVHYEGAEVEVVVKGTLRVKRVRIGDEIYFWLGRKV